MPLSPKQVYKKPPIMGFCPYGDDPEKMRIRDGASGGEDLPEKAARQDFQEDSSTVDFWPQEKSVSIKPEPGNPSAAAAEMHQSQYSSAELARIKKDIAQQAKHEAEAALQKNIEQRLQEGYQQGLAKAEDETKKARSAAATSLKEAEISLREARLRSKEIVASSEQKIVELAVAVAEKLIRAQLELAPDTIVSIARAALNILNGGEQVELYVNSADLESCRRYSNELKAEFNEVIKLDVYADDSLARGSCRVESESGIAEYLLDEEKNQLKETLINISRKEPAEITGGEDTAYGKH